MTKSPKSSQGIYFDLMQVYSELNDRFFDGKIEARVRWGIKRTKSVGLKRTIRLGSYQPKNKLITINPCLDQAVVPQICLERILFHEMAHQKFPARRASNGKIMVHYREFNDFEKNYPHLKLADHWIKANLKRLLGF